MLPGALAHASRRRGEPQQGLRQVMLDGPTSRNRYSLCMNEGPKSQPPELLRRLLRAKDRMDGASHEEWPVSRLAAGSRPP